MKIPSLLLPLAVSIAALLPLAAVAGTTWDGGGGDDNWGTGANWNPDGAPPVGNTVDLTFAGVVRLTPNNNYTAFDDFRSIFFASGAGTFTIGGNAIDLFGKIENSGSSTQTFNLTVGTGSVSGGFIEMNPVNGNLNVGGADVFLGNNQLRVFGNNGNTLTFGTGTIISGAGGTVAINQNSTTVYQSAHTYTGGTFVNAGKLSFGAGGSANSSTINILDTSGSNNATLELAPLAGGLTLTSPIVVRSGSSGAATLNSLNTSGANALTGALTLNKDLTVSQAAGGRLNLGGGTAITGAGAFIKTGGGEVAINANVNTPGGGWTVNGGTLVSNGGRLDGGNVVINTGGTYQAQTGGGDSVGNTRSVTVNSGGAFDFQQASTETIASLSLNGTGIGSTGALVNTANTLASLTGATTLAGNASIGITQSTARITLNSPISGAFSLTKVGVGNLSLAVGSPSFSGGLTVTTGSVNLAGANNGQSTAGTGTLTIGSGTTVTATSHNVFGHSADANIPDVIINGGTLTPFQFVHLKNIEMTAGTIANGGTGAGAGGMGLDMSHGTRIITTRASATTSTIAAAIQTSSAGIGKVTFNVEDGAIATDMTMSGSIVGAGGVLKTGAGTMSLDASNSFAGGLTIDGGKVIANGGSGKLANSSLVTVNTTGIFQIDGTNSIPTGGTSVNFIINAGGNVLVNSGNHVHFGTITLNGGSLTGTAGKGSYNGEDIQLNGNVTVGGSVASTINLPNGLALVGARTFTVADATASSAADLILTGTAAGGILQDNDTAPGDSLIKEGAGTMQFNAAATYSGSTTINNGRLIVSNTLRDTSSIDVIGAGASLETGAINIFVPNHGTTVAASRVITVNAGTWLMNGSMDSRIGNVTLTNGGTWTSNRGLSGFDALLADTSTGAATVTVSGTGASTMNGSGGIHLQGVQNFAVADVTSSPAADLTVSLILDGPGSSGGATGGINKTGAGKMVLTNANSYTGGTTIGGGTLEAAATGALGSTSNVAINTGGTLLLSGAGTNRMNDAAAITLAGGTIAFSGNVTEGSSPGAGALTLTANSIIDFASGNSVINFGDSSAVVPLWTGGAILSIYNWDGLVTGGGNDQLKFGTGNTALTSTQLSQISFFSGAGSGFLGTATFVGSLGEVVPVPEPSGVALAMGLLGLIGWRERRKARRSIG